MMYLYAMLAGIAGTIAGWFVAAMAALVIGGLTGMSNFEGGRAMFAVWGAGPIGGLIGLILGIVLVLRYRERLSGFGAIVRRGVMVAAGIAALMAVGLLVRLYTTPNLSQPYPRVVFEIRLPPEVKIPDRKQVKITLDTDRNQTDALLDPKWIAQENGRPVLRGFVDLYMRTTNRLLVLKIAGEPDRIFQIKLWGNPGRMDAYTDWEQVEYIGEDRGILRRADEKDNYEFRFRVEREG